MTYKWIRNSFLIAISLLVFGFLFSCKNPNNTKSPEEEPGIPVPSEVGLESIEVAIVDEESGRAKLEEFKSLEGFKSEKSGTYQTEEAKTACITLKVKKAKPASGDDFEVEVSNKTTYIEPLKFMREPEGDDSYFVLKEKYNEKWYNKVVALSKGRNILEIKVKNPDKSVEGTYTVSVQYAGGPDPVALEMDERHIIPGIYCPAQRKPLEGEKPDLVWMIVMAGW